MAPSYVPSYVPSLAPNTDSNVFFAHIFLNVPFAFLVLRVLLLFEF